MAILAQSPILEMSSGKTRLRVRFVIHNGESCDDKVKGIIL